MCVYTCVYVEDDESPTVRKIFNAKLHGDGTNRYG